MRFRWNFAKGLVGIFLLAGIVEVLRPTVLAQPAPDPQKIGVYASGEGRLQKLTVFGIEDRDIPRMERATVMRLDDLGGVIRLATVNALFMNLPGSNPLEARMVWMPALSRYMASSPNIAPGAISPGATSIAWREITSAEIERVSGDLFKFTSPELDRMKSGVMALLVKMPLGSPDRIYPVQVGSGAQSQIPPPPSPGTTIGIPGGVQGSSPGGIQGGLVGRVLQPKYPGVPAYAVEHVHGGLSENCRGTLYLFTDRVKYDADSASNDSFESPISELQDVKAMRGLLSGFSMKLNSSKNYRFRVDPNVAREIVGKIMEARQK